LIVHNCAYGLSGGEITEDDEGNEVKSGLLGYADSMGIELEPEFAQKCVDIFRNAYPEIPATWYSLQDAFARVVEQNTIEEVNHVTMRMKGKVLCITLPSGRDLHYINPRTHQEERKSRRGNMYKATVISYEGINQKTRQWERVTTWGGKIFENIVQAVCRDILAYGMLEADREGFSIVLHVHDEIVAEVPETGKLGYEKLVECMCRVPFWCPGFLIGAEGFENSFYKKES
jgi:DNA polymerase